MISMGSYLDKRDGRRGSFNVQEKDSSIFWHCNRCHFYQWQTIYMFVKVLCFVWLYQTRSSDFDKWINNSTQASGELAHGAVEGCQILLTEIPPSVISEAQIVINTTLILLFMYFLIFFLMCMHIWYDISSCCTFIFNKVVISNSDNNSIKYFIKNIKNIFDY